MSVQLYWGKTRSKTRRIWKCEPFLDRNRCKIHNKTFKTDKTFFIKINSRSIHRKSLSKQVYSRTRTNIWIIDPAIMPFSLLDYMSFFQIVFSILKFEFESSVLYGMGIVCMIKYSIEGESLLIIIIIIYLRLSSNSSFVLSSFMILLL